MEQKFILKNPNSFNLEHIFECGQCFRWNKQEDGSYTGIFKENVLNIKQDGADFIFEGICNGNIKDIIEDYFDLNRDYEEMKNALSQIDESMATSIKYGEGIRLLNQDLWETIISFIISANNNIPRIKGIIERLSAKYGKEINWKGQKYYTFPTPKELQDVTVEEYRKLGLGFRDIRLFETVHMVLNGEVNLQGLRDEKDTFKVREEISSV